MRRWLILGVGLLVIGAVVGLTMIIIAAAQPVPAAIKRQADFPIFYPKNSDFKPDKASYKFDDKDKLLTYVAKQGTNSITLTEQATPDTFNDIPQYFDKLSEKLNQYSSFDTPSGKVNLTHPKELKGGQTAVMNGKGTLLFARPEHDLSDSDWRRFFNSLEIIK